MIKDKKWIDLLESFAINLIFLFIYVTSFELILESNDDMVISLMLEGAYGEYTEYTIYQNILWGKFIIALNQLIPTVKWYMVIMYFMMFLSFVGITYVFLRAQGRKLGTAISVVMLIFCGYHSYVIFQYSRVAAGVTAGGLMLLFFALDYAKGKREKVLCIIMGSFLSLWASMIRFPMFAMSTALMVGALGLFKIATVIIKKDSIKKLIPYVALFGTVGILSVGLYLIDKSFYDNNEEWNEYIEFNDVRTELLDYGFPDYYANYDLYQSLGVTENDYLFHLYWHMDAEMLGTDKQMALVEAKGEKVFNASEFLELFPKKFLKISLFVLFLVAGLFSIALNKKNLYFVLAEFCGIMIFEAYFFTMGRYGIERVDCSMWMVAVLVLLYAISDDLKNLQLESWRWVLVIVGSVLLINMSDLYQETHPQSGMVNSTNDFYNAITMDKEHLYVFTSGAPMVYYSFEFWEPSQQGELSNVYNAYGWDVLVEVKDNILDNYGISNVFRDGINNEKVYFIAAANTDLLKTYIQENYNSNVYFQMEKEIFGYAVWSIKADE